MIIYDFNDNRFQVLMNSFLDSMQMADEATYNSSGYARGLQEKYEESFNGRLQKLKTTGEEFWINFLNNEGTNMAIDSLTKLIELFTQLTDVITPLGTALGAIFATQGLKKFFSGDFKIGEKISNVVG